MQAPQVVQAQAASGESAKVSSGCGLASPLLEATVDVWPSVVQLHALVDLKCRGAEGFAGRGRGTRVLAAIALDAGVGIEQARPGEVLELFRAKLWGLGFEVECNRGKDAGRNVACEEVLHGRHEDVHVLGVREVREEEQDAAESAPIAEDAPCGCILWREEMREERSKGSVGIGTVERELRARADGSAAYVEEDEGGDDQRIDRDVSFANILM